MAQFDLYVDISAQGLVSGISNPAAAPAPPFVQGDTPTFRVFLLQRTQTFPLGTPYTILPVTGLTLEAALGQKAAGATVYTQQLVWTPSTDPTNPNYWTATFPMNTAGINTLLTGVASAQAVFELKYFLAGVPITVLQAAVTVYSAVLTAGAPVVPPGFNPASVEFCMATFLQRQITGQIVLKNPNTGKLMALYLGDDGAFHADPLN